MLIGYFGAGERPSFAPRVRSGLRTGKNRTLFIIYIFITNPHKAGNGSRTRDYSLEESYFTTKLYPLCGGLLINFDYQKANKLPPVAACPSFGGDQPSAETSYFKGATYIFLNLSTISRFS